MDGVSAICSGGMELAIQLPHHTSSSDRLHRTIETAVERLLSEQRENGS